jgi:hypothetical protein
MANRQCPRVPQHTQLLHQRRRPLRRGPGRRLLVPLPPGSTRTATPTADGPGLPHLAATLRLGEAEEAATQAQQWPQASPLQQAHDSHFRVTRGPARLNEHLDFAFLIVSLEHARLREIGR